MIISEGQLTYSMNVVDIIEDDNVTLGVRVEVSEGSAALLQIQRSALKDVHQWQPLRRAEASAAVVHDAVGSDVFCSHLVHTATAQGNQTPLSLHFTFRKNVQKCLIQNHSSVQQAAVLSHIIMHVDKQINITESGTPVKEQLAATPCRQYITPSKTFLS